MTVVTDAETATMIGMTGVVETATMTDAVTAMMTVTTTGMKTATSVAAAAMTTVGVTGTTTAMMTGMMTATGAVETVTTAAEGCSYEELIFGTSDSSQSVIDHKVGAGPERNRPMINTEFCHEDR